MTSASSLYNLLFVPKPQPPPYNPISKLVMKVETETVQIRNVPGGAALEPEKNYPHYPVLERKLETVEGDGAVLTSETTTMNPKTKYAGGSSWYSPSYASSSASSEVGDEDDAPSWQWRPKLDRQSGSPSSSGASNKSSSLWRWRSKPNSQPESPSFSSSVENSASPYRRSGSISSFSSLGSFSSGPDSPSRPGLKTDTRIVGVVKGNGEMKMFKGKGIVVEEHPEDVASTES